MIQVDHADGNTRVYVVEEETSHEVEPPAGCDSKLADASQPQGPFSLQP